MMLAIHGTNRVTVTIATTSCCAVSDIVKNPAAPKSRRTKPITKAVAASGGRPSQPTVSGSAACVIQRECSGDVEQR